MRSGADGPIPPDRPPAPYRAGGLLLHPISTCWAGDCRAEHTIINQSMLSTATPVTALSREESLFSAETTGSVARSGASGTVTRNGHVDEEPRVTSEDTDSGQSCRHLSGTLRRSDGGEDVPVCRSQTPTNGTHPVRVPFTQVSTPFGAQPRRCTGGCVPFSYLKNGTTSTLHHPWSDALSTVPDTPMFRLWVFQTTYARPPAHARTRIRTHAPALAGCRKTPTTGTSGL